MHRPRELFQSSAVFWLMFGGSRWSRVGQEPGNLGNGRSILLSRTFCKTTPSTADKNYRHVGRASLQQNFLQAAQLNEASRPKRLSRRKVAVRKRETDGPAPFLRAISISPCC